MISQQEIEWYQQIMPDLGVVFDVGCRSDNIFYDINPNLDLHLFDPLRPNKKMYGKFNNIALSDTIGESSYFPEYGSLEKRELKGDKWEWLTHKNIQVPTDTLDNYCHENNITKIDLLKIDTEGHDLSVLMGATRMIPTIKYIQFEGWTQDKNDKIMELLEDYKIDILGGLPVNYKCIRVC